MLKFSWGKQDLFQQQQQTSGILKKCNINQEPIFTVANEYFLKNFQNLYFTFSLERSITLERGYTFWQ